MLRRSSLLDRVLHLLCVFPPHQSLVLFLFSFVWAVTTLRL
jgi:hypothetical protein